MKKNQFLLIVFLTFFLVSNANALSVDNASFYTENFGANPFGWAEGHSLQFGANVFDDGGVKKVYQGEKAEKFREQFSNENITSTRCQE